MPREGFRGRLLDFSLTVHKFLDTIPGALESGHPVAVQLMRSASMIGPKYAGIVPGMDRARTLERLELCKGNAEEAVYWLECAQTHWPDRAERAKEIHQEALQIADIMRERLHSFSRPTRGPRNG